MDILIAEPDAFPDMALTRLRQLGSVYFPPDYVAERIEAVFVRLAQRIDYAFFCRHPSLRFIISPTTGLNHIDTAFFDRVGVRVISLKGRAAFLDNVHATAEHCVALTLSLLRRIPAAVDAVRSGVWNRYDYKGRELFGKTVLIIGYGRLGRQVDHLFSAFGAKVIAFDRDAGRVPETKFVGLEEGLAVADIVTIHVNLEKANEGLIGAEVIAQMKPSACLINTSRGELVDQDALFAQIASGRLGGAALDVLISEPEPLTEVARKSLVSLGGRLIVTPHIGGFTHESLEKVENFISDVFISEVYADRAL
jgi:phosphoglycerate dehydrogenase-like enzyme